LARNTPVFLLLVDMRFVRKPIDPIELIKVPLVVLALMFECDPRVETKGGWEKKVGAIHCRRSVVGVMGGGGIRLAI
jgi:hypothetical protein